MSEKERLAHKMAYGKEPEPQTTSKLANKKLPTITPRSEQEVITALKQRRFEDCKCLTFLDTMNVVCEHLAQILHSIFKSAPGVPFT